MTVRGGYVRIEPTRQLPGNETYPPSMYVKIEVTANFPEDMDEIIEILFKRLIEAQMKTNLEICGIVDGDEE